MFIRVKIIMYSKLVKKCIGINWNANYVLQLYVKSKKKKSTQSPRICSPKYERLDSLGDQKKFSLNEKNLY